MNKIKFFTLVFAISVLFPVNVFAGEGGHGMNVDEVLRQIMQNQEVSRLGDIDCESVSEENFEKLGEAVMSVMHPDPEQHDLMDRMMGGEGSKQLEAMHTYMGKKYLNCGGGGMNMMSGMMGSGMMSGMMGSGMMGSGMMNNGFSAQKSNGFMNGSMSGFGMMSGSPFMGGFFGYTFMILFWVFVVIGIVWLIRSVMFGKRGTSEISPRALDTLKNRYAKGEITKEEFDMIKNDIS